MIGASTSLFILARVGSNMLMASALGCHGRRASAFASTSGSANLRYFLRSSDEKLSDSKTSLFDRSL
eukprot:8834896-Pyramimonas_sp.AAC.1